MEREKFIEQLRLECKLLGNNELTSRQVTEIIDDNRLILDFTPGGRNFRVIPITVIGQHIEKVLISGLKLVHWSYPEDMEIPEGIFQLKNMKSLSITNSDIDNISDDIKMLEYLEELFIENVRIKHLPDSIGRLISLKELTLLNNHLSYLPESICGLPRLETLQLNNNKLIELPECFDELYQRLEHFSAKNNQVNLSYPPKRCKSHCGYKIDA